MNVTHGDRSVKWSEAVPLHAMEALGGVEV
jgi:hypothetical protein